MKKRAIAIIFGGKSPEHEVSIISAKSIYHAIDQDKFEVSLIGISPAGKWFLIQEADFLAADFQIKTGRELYLLPGHTQDQIRILDTGKSVGTFDAVFPIVHGTNGEDGTLQGLLRHLNIPFVGPDVLGSAVAMDKDVCKRLFIEKDIGCAEGIVIHHYEKKEINYEKIVEKLGQILFIKPCNMGSSVGVHKSMNKKDFYESIEDAFLYDSKILVEKAIVGREIECAVLGNEDPQASTVGEIVMEKGFYDFESKYQSADNAKLYIPALNLSEELIAKIKDTAIRAYRCLELEGMSRVDVFVTATQEVIVNEVNTLPGFTSISMYPKLWEKSGIAYKELITNLIDLAIQREQKRQELKSTRL